MSLYNLMNGFNPACVLILPMLGKDSSFYPRFRDCYVENEDIFILTRTGGGNREDYIKENHAMASMPTYIVDYDDNFDNTYATWQFSVPEEWKSDFKRIMNGFPERMSEEYLAEIGRFYPNLIENIREKLGR